MGGGTVRPSGPSRGRQGSTRWDPWGPWDRLWPLRSRRNAWEFNLWLCLINLLSKATAAAASGKVANEQARVKALQLKEKEKAKAAELKEKAKAMGILELRILTKSCS